MISRKAGGGWCWWFFLAEVRDQQKGSTWCLPGVGIWENLMEPKKTGTNFWNSSCFGNEMIWSEGESRLFIHNWLWTCVELSLLVEDNFFNMIGHIFRWNNYSMDIYNYLIIYSTYLGTYDFKIWFVCWVVDSYYSLAGHCHTLLPEMMNLFGVALQNIRRWGFQAFVHIEQINCSTLLRTLK